MHTFIIPVIPNKAEAWRRFMQELEGSQSKDFMAWCRQLDMRVKEVWLNETLKGTTLIATITIGDSEAALARLVETTTPFEHWLKEQILILHGVDFVKIAQGYAAYLYHYSNWTKF